MKIPENLQYTAEHLWIRQQDDGSWLAGITDYAQDLLGDIVYVEAPAVGTAITAGTPCGLVESVKTGSDLHAPASGSVLAINEALQSTPEDINDKPYDAWIFSFTSSALPDNLLNAEQYRALLG
ncbi:glycine cleavage system protein GcvH [Methylobacillus gramineus]|uniref:glycine cleavage system protein GcvH n=1 Tax=Methylobacillus gramineus TaxID=755169 RepID=UPI001CFFFA68|nr:glycine cleavage system protein GcvH [Methylobacillus gramineus]MCB5185607.1 glycine cleavage system protein GcvH [Methylobacillus gramineus]